MLGIFRHSQRLETVLRFGTPHRFWFVPTFVAPFNSPSDFLPSAFVVARAAGVMTPG
jgi:hypothetical protein